MGKFSLSSLAATRKSLEERVLSAYAVPGRPLSEQWLKKYGSSGVLCSTFHATSTLFPAAIVVTTATATTANTTTDYCCGDYWYCYFCLLLFNGKVVAVLRCSMPSFCYCLKCRPPQCQLACMGAKQIAAHYVHVPGKPSSLKE